MAPKELTFNDLELLFAETTRHHGPDAADRIQTRLFSSQTRGGGGHPVVLHDGTGYFKKEVMAELMHF